MTTYTYELSTSVLLEGREARLDASRSLNAEEVLVKDNSVVYDDRHFDRLGSNTKVIDMEFEVRPIIDNKPVLVCIVEVDGYSSINQGERYEFFYLNGSLIEENTYMALLNGEVKDEKLIGRL